MKKMLLICGALLAFSAAAAFAQVTAPGLYLNWGGNCIGDTPLQLKTYACTSIAGSDVLLSSWVPAVAVPTFAGLEEFIYLAVDGGVLPAYWGTTCAGRTAVAVNQTAPSSAVNCADVWAGMGGGGLSGYNLNANGPGTVVIDVIGAVPAGSEQALDAGIEYFTFNLILSHAKARTTDACLGCLIPACINFKELRYDEPAPIVEKVTTAPGLIGTANRAYVNWQGPVVNCTPGASPSKNATWGSVKALYR